MLIHNLIRKQMKKSSWLSAGFAACVCVPHLCWACGKHGRVCTLRRNV